MSSPYDNVRQELEAAGFDVEPFDRRGPVTGLEIRAGHGATRQSVVAFTQLESDWYVFFGATHYRTTSAQSCDRCWRLAVAEFQATGTVDPAAIARRLGDKMVLVRTGEWSERASAVCDDRRRRAGWTELPRDDTDRYWSIARTRLGFPGGDGTFREPTPSTTWNISRFFEAASEQQEAWYADYRTRLVRAFRRCVARDEHLIVLDWNHTCYRFAPWSMPEQSDFDHWAVEPLPMIDHCIFIEQDFQFGLLGHLDDTICIFGARLLAAVEADTPRMLHTVLRLDGRAIEH